MKDLPYKEPENRCPLCGVRFPYHSPMCPDVRVIEEPETEEKALPRQDCRKIMKAIARVVVERDPQRRAALQADAHDLIESIGGKSGGCFYG